MHDVNTIKIDGDNEDEFNYEYLENIIKNNKEKIVSIKERIIEIEERKRESILKINLEWIEYCYKGILEELTETKTTYLYTQDIKFFETIINELKGEIKRFAN